MLTSWIKFKSFYFLSFSPPWVRFSFVFLSVFFLCVSVHNTNATFQLPVEIKLRGYNFLAKGLRNKKLKDMIGLLVGYLFMYDVIKWF